MAASLAHNRHIGNLACSKSACNASRPVPGSGCASAFGAQTLVRDVISGVFFLLEDAFRVGEYIQSSNYKGTVESFSIRSVRLRHHRGPVYTVPFGLLGAIENQSRDWVIDKDHGRRHL
jgi:small-conductance mechanosensitive channel